MSTATATITPFGYPNGFDTTNRTQIMRGTIAISPGTYPPGGFPLQWATEYVKSTWVGSQTSATGVTTVQVPTEVDVWSAGDPPSGYVYATDRTTGNLHIMVQANGSSGASGPLVEYGGNTLNSMQVDTIQFTAVFPKNI